MSEEAEKQGLVTRRFGRRKQRVKSVPLWRIRKGDNSRKNPIPRVMGRVKPKVFILGKGKES